MTITCPLLWHAERVGMQDGDEPGSEVEVGESDDVFNASGDEEPIFAYISMASGIVTPAKAAQTPATAAKASTAKKTRHAADMNLCVVDVSLKAGGYVQDGEWAHLPRLA